MLDHVCVEFELRQVAGAGEKGEFSCGRERQQGPQASASRAIARENLPDVHLNFVADLAALTAAGICLRHGCHRMRWLKLTP